MEQYRLEFKAENGYPSACNITIHRAIQLVVAEETGEGQSVTNACEFIATEVVKRYDVDPERMLFIEHYPAAQRPTYGESFDLVTFRWDGKRFWNPDWRHLPPHEVYTILNAVKS